MLLLKILSVTGITILYILGFIFTLILVVLFVPIRYKIKGSYKDKDADVKAVVSYLGFVFRLSVIYSGKTFNMVIRIFGIPLKKKDKKKTSQNKSDDSDKDSENSENEDSREDSSENEENKEEKESVFKKIKGLKEKAEFYINLIKKNSTKRAFAFAKNNLLKMLKSILPKKGKINLWLGLENAGTTGEILGAYKALYDYIGKVVNFYPYFDRQYIECNLNVKGRIYSFVLLYRIIRIYLNKDCNKLIKTLRKNKKADAGKENQ